MSQPDINAAASGAGAADWMDTDLMDAKRAVGQGGVEVAGWMDAEGAVGDFRSPPAGDADWMDAGDMNALERAVDQGAAACTLRLPTLQQVVRRQIKEMRSDPGRRLTMQEVVKDAQQQVGQGELGRILVEKALTDFFDELSTDEDIVMMIFTHGVQRPNPHPSGATKSCAVPNRGIGKIIHTHCNLMGESQVLNLDTVLKLQKCIRGHWPLSKLEDPETLAKELWDIQFGKDSRFVQRLKEKDTSITGSEFEMALLGKWECSEYDLGQANTFKDKILGLRSNEIYADTNTDWNIAFLDKSGDIIHLPYLFSKLSELYTGATGVVDNDTYRYSLYNIVTIIHELLCRAVSEKLRTLRIFDFSCHNYCDPKFRAPVYDQNLIRKLFNSLISPHEQTCSNNEVRKRGKSKRGIGEILAVIWKRIANLKWGIGNNSENMKSVDQKLTSGLGLVDGAIAMDGVAATTTGGAAATPTTGGDEKELVALVAALRDELCKGAAMRMSSEEGEEASGPSAKKQKKWADDMRGHARSLGGGGGIKIPKPKPKHKIQKSVKSQRRKGKMTKSKGNPRRQNNNKKKKNNTKKKI